MECYPCIRSVLLPMCPVAQLLPSELFHKRFPYQPYLPYPTYLTSSILSSCSKASNG